MRNPNLEQTGSIDLEELADDLVAGTRELDETTERVTVTLYGLLAEGKPVSRERLAEGVGLPQEGLSELIDSWFGIFFDDDGNIVSLWGLAQPEMAFRFEVDGNQLYTWCAWDSLFIPQIIGKTAHVEGTSPTGEEVSLTVSPDGVGDVSPPDAVLSFLRPENGFDENVIQSFCHHVLFFPSEAVAREWMAGRGDTFVLTIEEGFELGRLWAEKRFGLGLAAHTKGEEA